MDNKTYWPHRASIDIEIYLPHSGNPVCNHSIQAVELTSIEPRQIGLEAILRAGINLAALKPYWMITITRCVPFVDSENKLQFEDAVVATLSIGQLFDWSADWKTT